MGLEKWLEFIGHYENILESTNNVDIMVSDNKGIILEVNEKCEEVYGCKSEYMIGKSVFELETEGIFNPSSVAKVLETKKEVNLVQKIRDDKNYRVTAVPIKDNNGEILRVVTYSRDIEGYNSLKDWSKELNNKISKYNEKIKELELKYEEVDRLLGRQFDLNKINVINNNRHNKEGMHTNNSEFKVLLKEANKIAKYDVNVLILGETGVGKSMLAHKIHMLSNYKNGEFVEVNCGAIPEHLIESELFGYTKGSFTGADKEGKKGLIEMAHKGTLFLDEVSELPIASQVKLLKVLQDKVVRRIGETKGKKVDFRIISATNKDLNQEVSNGNFRIDLMYRLNTISFKIPSLRERKEDIAYLSKLLLKQYNDRYNENKSLSREVINMFENYSWPGNIREMENIIQGLILSTDEEVILKERLPKHMKVSESNKIQKYDDISKGDLNKMIDKFECEIIKKYYNKYKSSTKMSKALNISQATAARKIKKYIQS